MTLSTDVNLNRYVDQQLRTLAVKNSTVIYRGGLVGLDRSTGYAQPLSATTQFQGIAYEQCDNSTGQSGDREVILFTQGDFEFSLSGASRVHIGRPVFATDDNTLTLSGGSASYIGQIIDSPAAGRVIVRIDPLRRLTKTVTAPLASTTGSAASNAVAIFSTPVVIVKAQVWFETKPDAGYLDIGTDNSDPDEIVDNFNLTTLTNATASNLTLAGTTVPANTRIWAKVGAATTTAGAGGGLAIEYFNLP
ncbi:MAG: hypothetical protein WC975_07280 [Phycisphaerae bacterium]